MNVKVRPKRNENIIGMLRRLKKLCEREGIIREVKKHSYYEKPSDAKRRKSRKMLRRAQQEQEENQNHQQTNNR